jgi:hypothetical protein
VPILPLIAFTEMNNCMTDRCGIGIYDGNIAVNVRIYRRLPSEQKKDRYIAIFRAIRIYLRIIIGYP